MAGVLIVTFPLAPFPRILHDFRLPPELPRPLRKSRSSKRRVLAAVLARDDTKASYLVVDRCLLALFPLSMEACSVYAVPPAGLMKPCL